MNQEINIFDRKLLKSNRQRAAKNFHKFDFLYKEIAGEIIEKVADFKQNFNSILEIGAADGFLGKKLKELKNSDSLIQADCCDEMLNLINSKDALLMDEESLNFEEASFDLIVSNCNLHFINDLPGFLIQTKRALKKEGFFIAAFFGGQTLKELREAFYQAELQLYGGISPRMIPFIDVKDAGMLMQRAGFSDVVAVSENIEVDYDNILKLLLDLKYMGQGNILFKRNRKFITRKFLSLLENKYRELIAGNSKNIIANFEVITISGWN